MGSCGSCPALLGLPWRLAARSQHGRATRNESSRSSRTKRLRSTARARGRPQRERIFPNEVAAFLAALLRRGALGTSLALAGRSSAARSLETRSWLAGDFRQTDIHLNVGLSPQALQPSGSH